MFPLKLNLNIPLNSLSNKELKILQYIHDNEDRISTMSIQTSQKKLTILHLPFYAFVENLASVDFQN